MPSANINPRAQLRIDRPDSWIPVEDGDKIRGEVLELVSAFSDVQARDNQGDGAYPLLRIKVIEATGYEAGITLAVHAFSSVLQSRVVEQQPTIGETIEIIYEGLSTKQPRPGESPTALYRLTVEGRSAREVADRVYAGMSRRRARRPATAQEPRPGNGTGDEDLSFLS